MTTPPPATSGPEPSDEGREAAAPTPLEVAETFEHAHVTAPTPDRAAPTPGRAPTPDRAAPTTDRPTTPGADGGEPHEGEPDEQGARADRVVAAVLAVPGVVRLHAGVFGEVATYLPGRAVTGVRLRPDETEVHLVVSADRPIPAVARDVHEAVRDLVPGPVRVFVEDVESLPAPPSAP